MTIIQNVSRGVGKGLDFANKHLWLKKVSDYGYKNPDSFANGMLIASIASKDVIGCGLYVYQSFHNKDIPEDKRGAVAALDLVNGVLMVGGQVVIAKIFEKHVTSYLFDKFAGKKLDKDTLEEHAGKFVEQQKQLGKNVDIKEVGERMIKEFGSESKNYKALRGGAGLFVSFLLTTALTKRVLVPFIATPIAGWYKNKFMGKKNKAEIVLTPAMVNSTMPKTTLNKVSA